MSHGIRKTVFQARIFEIMNQHCVPTWKLKKNNTEIKIKQLIETNQNYETNKNRTILSSQLSFTLFDIEFWINTAFIDVSEYSFINGKF